MLLARIAGNRTASCAALLYLVAGSASFAGAQQAPKSRAPVPRTIILPVKMVVGAPATLAVLDAAGRLLPGVVVVLSTGQKVTTDATGRALIAALAEQGKLLATVQGRPGQEISATSPVMATTSLSLICVIRLLGGRHFLPCNPSSSSFTASRRRSCCP